MYLHTTSLTLLTGLNCFVPRARPFSLRSAHWQSRLPQLFVDPALAPFPITGLRCWACLQLALPAVHLYPAGPTPFICIHLRWDRIVTRGHTNSQGPCHCQYTKVGPGPCSWPYFHHCVYVCNQALSLHRPLQVVPIAKCMQIRQLLLSALIPRDCTWRSYWELQQPFKPLWIYHSPCQETCSCYYCGSQ